MRWTELLQDNEILPIIFKSLKMKAHFIFEVTDHGNNHEAIIVLYHPFKQYLICLV